MRHFLHPGLRASLAVLAGVVLVPTVVVAIELGCLPPFAIGAPLATRSSFAARGVRIATATPGGELEIEAALAEPGHERLGVFELGPSTFMRLRGVQVRCRRGTEVVWSVQAVRGRLDAATLTLSRSTLERAGVPPTLARGARVDLDTGELSER